MLPSSDARKAITVSPVQVRSAKVAPVTTTDSPSAMMMKPAQRSAMWPPSTTQSETVDAPYFGIQNFAAGEIYSIASAIPHNTSRVCPSVRPPAIDPQHTRGREPDQDAKRVHPRIRPIADRAGQQESGAPDLHHA